MSNGLNGSAEVTDVSISSPHNMTVLQARINSHTQTLSQLARCGDLYGASAPMQQLFEMIGKVAPTTANVLIAGESGTGKELVAQAIHQLSRERDQPFVALNCSAVSPQLIEAELFGHERGSFTGAIRMQKGCFERAHGGTLFLCLLYTSPSPRD